MNINASIRYLLIAGALVFSGLFYITDAYPEVPHEDNPSIDNVVDAFENLTERGEWLGFHRDTAPDTTPDCLPIGPLDFAGIFKCRTNEHTQGIARSPRTGIPPIIYVTRSGNVDSPTRYGSLMVIELGTRGTDGERMRSNRLVKYRQTKHTAPEATDIVIRNIPFDGIEAPWYGHPGGLQMIGDILMIALEGPKDGQSLPMSKIIFFDCADPKDPKLMDYQLDFETHEAAAPGIVKLPDGTFYMALTWGDDETIEFYRSNKTSFYLEDGTQDSAFEFGLHTTITKDRLQGLVDAGYWRFERVSPQSLNFVKDVNDNFYLIGAANAKNTAPTINGEETIWLWRLDWENPDTTISETERFMETDIFNDPWFFPTDNQVTLVPVRKAAKHLLSDGVNTYCGNSHVNCRQEANFNAGTGLYITPSRELLYYGTSHFNIGPNGTFNFAELRYDMVSRTGTCGPQWRNAHLGGPYDIDEGTSIILDGSASFIEPWVQMYKHANYSGQTVMMDWADQALDNYNNFSELDGALNANGEYGFNDMLSSLRWCGSKGSYLTIWSDFGLKGSKSFSMEGDGLVQQIYNFGGGFNDIASSAEILWWPVVDNFYWWDLDGDGQFDDASSAQASFHAGSGNSTNIVRLNYLSTANPNDGTIVETTINVHNIPASIDSFVLDNATPEEGQQITVTGSWSDPGTDIASVSVDWVDSSLVEEDQNSVGVFSFSHVYGDNGIFQIEVCVSDQDDNTCQTLETTVSNIAPVVTIGSVEQENPFFILPLVHTLQMSGSFEDSGWLDTHTSSWDFDDTTSGAGNLSEENEQPDASGTTTIEHIYGMPGSYTLTLTVTDDDNASDNKSTTVTVLSALNAVEVIAHYIQDLPDEAFGKSVKKTRKGILKKIGKVGRKIDTGSYGKAIKELDKLKDDIGLTDYGKSKKSKNDLIKDPQAQQDILQMINDLITYLGAI